MDNAARYGIRLHSLIGGGSMPKNFPNSAKFASAYQPAVNGGGNCTIGIGDPITGLASGMCALADGVEGAGGGLAVKGIITECLPQWSATEGTMVMRNPIQGGIVYGTNLSRQTQALYVRADVGVWEMDVVNASTSFDTIAEYQAADGANADHRLVYDSATLRANPKLDLATVATTAAQWRIQDISRSSLNMDVTGANFKVLVTCFEFQSAAI